MQDALITLPLEEQVVPASMSRGLDDLSDVSIEPELGPWWALDRRARLIVKSDGTVIGSDHLARSLMESKTGFFVRHGRLVLVDPKLRPALERILRAPLGARRCLVVPAGTAGSLLLQSIGFACASGAAVALSARLVSEDVAPEYKGLGEAFDLTSAEEMVAQQLLRGLTPAEISTRCHLSINTIRTHIAHVYAKLGVGSREAMWRRCGAFQVG